jgi:hypothetical protein
VLATYFRYFVYRLVTSLSADTLQEGEHNLPEGQIPPGLSVPPKQQEHITGAPRGYARLAVMDGKTITHRVCFILFQCNPLV